MALALAIAIAAMQYLRVPHPPAGSNPFIVFLLGSQWDFLWMPTLIGSILIVLVACFTTTYQMIEVIQSIGDLYYITVHA
jgi:CBS-domain-containing membrane protein